MKLFLVLFFFLPCIAWAGKQSPKENSALDNSISIELPPIEENFIKLYKDTLRKRVIALEKYEVSLKEEENKLIITADSLSQEEVSILIRALKTNFTIKFFEILDNHTIDKEKSDLLYVSAKSSSAGKPFLIDKKGLVFNYSDLAEVKMIKEEENNPYHLTVMFKKTAEFNHFFEKLMKNKNREFKKVLTVLSDILLLAPPIHDSLKDGFTLSLPKIKQFEQDLLKMQIDNPLPFEVHEY